jgi:hypothetical protein
MKYRLTSNLPECPSCENDELFLFFDIEIRCYCCKFKASPKKFAQCELQEVIA